MLTPYKPVDHKIKLFNHDPAMFKALLLQVLDERFRIITFTACEGYYVQYLVVQDNGLPLEERTHEYRLLRIEVGREKSSDPEKQKIAKRTWRDTPNDTWLMLFDCRQDANDLRVNSYCYFNAVRSFFQQILDETSPQTSRIESTLLHHQRKLAGSQPEEYHALANSIDILEKPVQDNIRSELVVDSEIDNKNERPKWFPKGTEKRKEWARAYQVYLEMRTEYIEENFDGNPKIKTSEVVDRLKVEIEWVRGISTVRRVIKAGDSGWLDEYLIN